MQKLIAFLLIVNQVINLELKIARFTVAGTLLIIVTGLIRDEEYCY
jgi:hypothetical protein